MRRVLVLLPERPSGDAAAHWWRIEHGEVVECGHDERWVEFSAPPFGQLVALAPAAAVRLVPSEAVGTTDRQTAAIAAAAAREASVGDEVHSVAAVVGEGEQRGALAAVAATETMQRWLDWCRSWGREPAAIVPSPLLLPASDEWSDLRIGSEHLVGRGDLRFAYDPALVDALIGEERIHRVPADVVEEALVGLAEQPLLDLRQGRFALRQRWTIDRVRLRELALLAACIPLLALLATLVTIVRLNRDSDRIDRRTVEVASAALGRPVAAETALGEMDVQAARSGGGGGSLSVPLSALYRYLQANPAVSSTAISWNGDGTLTSTLAASRPEDINRVLLALQQGGYRVTAVPRTGTDGRQLADVTVRGGA